MSLEFTFQDLLIIFSFVIFFLFVLLIIIDKRTSGNLKQVIKQSSKLSVKYLVTIHTILLSIFLIMGISSFWAGVRPTLYFYLVAALLVSSILLANNRKSIKRSYFVLIFATILILGLFQSIIPIAENRFTVFGPDQWSYVLGAQSVVDHGTFFGIYFGDPYYSSVPLFVLLTSALTVFTGDVFVSTAVLTGVSAVVMTLAIYLLLFKLTKLHIAAVIAVFIFISIPQLSLIESIPSTLSLVIGSLMLLLIINFILKPERSHIIVIALLGLSAVIFHPIGIIVIIGLCTGLVVLPTIRLIKLHYLESKVIQGIFGLVILLSVTYWFSTDPIMNSVLNPLLKLTTTLSQPSSPTSVPAVASYHPNYFQAGFSYFSYAWAVPVAISAAYVAFLLVKFFSGKERGRLRSLFNAFSPVAGFIGLLAIALAFLSIINSPGASVERYMDTPAYLLLIIPSTVLCCKLISSKSKIVVVAVVCVLVSTVFVGVSSPDWAPFENTSFASVHLTYTGYVEARTIVPCLPNNSFLISDHDIGVSAIASSQNIPYSAPGSFQTSRNLLSWLKDGSFRPSDEVAEKSIYVIRADELGNASAINQYTNVLYNSGMHMLIEVPYDAS
jgi:hypothetical protein